MALRITGSVIGEPITSSSSSATGMWLSQEVAALQQDGIWQIAPGFTLTSSAATVNEGASITITLTTTGIPNGTAVPYVISGANIFANDSANGVITGNFVIQNNSNTISFAANADLLTEGSEAFTITAGGASTSVTINDTSLTPVPADAQFPYTTLALHGNGTNNTQNNTFLDSSTNNFSITRNGNSTQGTFSPYGGNWSNYFDGTGDVLVGPTSNTVFQLTNNGGTGLTVEAWIYPISTSGSKQIVTYYAYTDGSAEQGWYFRVLDGQLQCGNAFGGTSRSGGSIPVNTWTHVAFVINSGSFYLYVNGVSVGTVAGIGSQDYSGTTLVIGGLKQNGTNTNQVFNGYISNLRITNTAAYTGAFTPSTSPLTAIAGTSLLTCQDNRLIDESPNNFTITKTGDVSVQKFNPFSPVITTPTTYSAYLDGTGDYLTTPTSSSLGMGSGDFTIELWVYATNPTYAQGFFHIDATPIGPQVSGYAIGITAAGAIEYYSGVTYTTTSSTITAKTWTHLALVRSSGTVKVYVNGILPTSGGSIADSQNLTTALAHLGVFYALNYPMVGYISNFRVVKGTALYTSNFTPPTAPLTAITNTVLLTCQSPTFIDNSTNAFAITVNGNSQPTTVNPFGVTNTSSEYSTTTFGGSAYFDGSGDYLEAASNAAFALPGDFTYECWFNSDNTGTGSMFMEVPVNNGLQLYYNGSQLFVSAYAITSLISYTYTMPISTWVHIALVRKGTASNNVVLYINGISVATASYNSEFPQGPFRIGGTSYYFKGYISNCRLVKGTAVYQSNFAPPVAPITAVANTQLLCNFTNAGVIDNAMMTTLETVGDAKISTTQSKFGGTSMSFDGTGDYLAYTGGTSLNFGTGDFTIELWVYLANNGTFNPFIRPDASGSFVEFGHDFSAGQLKFQARDAAIVAVTTTMPTNQWAHVAACRSGTSLRLFINGTQVGSTTTNSTNFGLPTGTIRIGSSSFSGSHVISGYIDDFRITKGYARYTSNFTPPTEFANK